MSYAKSLPKIEKEKIEIAKNLIKQNLTKEQIIKATNISEKQLLTLLKL